MRKLLAEPIEQEEPLLPEYNKSSTQHFMIQAVVNMAKSQIHYISDEIKYMQSIKRFDNEYKADLQKLKDFRKELNHYIEKMRKLFIDNVPFDDEIINDFKLILRNQPVDIVAKYKKEC